DWDETITAHDTLSLIPPQHTTPPFADLGSAYMQDLESFHSEFQQKKNRDTTPQDLVSIYGLHPGSAPHLTPELAAELEYLHALDQVELTSVNRTERSGIFVGWDPVHAQERAKSREFVQIRTGWRDVVTWLVEQDSREVEMHVISVSWSATFILAGLRSHPDSLLPPASTYPTTLNANDPVLNTNNLGAGALSKSSSKSESGVKAGIRTGKHKLDVLRSLVHPASGTTTATTITIYVGDSSTDLPCLLHAHIGILIGNKHSMLTKLDGLGVVVENVDAFLERWQEMGRRALGGGIGSTQEPRLVGVADWVDVLRIFRALS
ncbi:unnamed protein product, partial [Tilletia controversa]